MFLIYANYNCKIFSYIFFRRFLEIINHSDQMVFLVFMNCTFETIYDPLTLKRVFLSRYPGIL